jgi:hypothetical protein
MNRFVIPGVLPLLAVLSSVPPANACAWDRDTLETEAKGVPDAIRVITGRFERNPDLYYEMRRARATRQIERTPNKLALYDDVGVACDRLHLGEEAILWMERKRIQIQKLRATARPGVLHAHRYRLLANEGTFIAHRWLRNGANRKQISEIKRARDLIAAAIKINPNAHFGREKYQLKLMEWIIKPHRISKEELPDFLGIYKIESAGSNTLSKLGYPDAVKGLSGLITLGDAWQSVDVFYALAAALQSDNQRTSVAYLAFLRCFELIGDGQKSLISPASGKKLETQIINGDYEATNAYMGDSNKLQTDFKTLRAEAEEWHAQRIAYMMPRLQAGRHPDWDETFWNEWQEPSAPSLYAPTAREQYTRYANIAAVMLGVLCVTFLALRFAKKRRR